MRACKTKKAEYNLCCCSVLKTKEDEIQLQTCNQVHEHQDKVLCSVLGHNLLISRILVAFPHHMFVISVASFQEGYAVIVNLL